jgi:hypothetical protein
VERDQSFSLRNYLTELKVSSDRQIYTILSQLFGIKMCKSWSKQLENDDLGVLNKEFFFLFLSVRTFISDLSIQMIRNK